MEEGGRVLVDASCSMLFEASGDSESGSYDAAELDDATAEDDAESCSAGGVVVDGGGGNDAIGDDDCVEGSGSGIDGGTEVEEGVVDQFHRSKAAAAEVNKSKGCEDSNMKLIGERDTDRLFWEACLAS